MTNNNYQLVCGMEIHAELKTKSKMFCSCKNDPFGAEKPNIYTCPVCLGMPGALPVANKKAIEWTIKLGLALNCKINLFSKFDRKNYFYPDLPKGYQISQYDIPFCYDGYLDTSEGRVRIHRIHLEEDTAKLVHKAIDFDGDGKKEKVSLIDFNRSSVPLVEIVTEADIKSGSQASEYGRKLRQILRYLDIADCDMEKGGMRLEANISLKKDSDGEDFLPNYKVECKNINSFRFVESAIEFEIKRQAEILDKDETPVQETRGYNAQTGKTFSQRSKEDAEDYRYFPDPDLPPIEFTQEQIDDIKADLPELPTAKLERFQEEFGLNEKTANTITEWRQTADFFEAVLKAAMEAKINAQKMANAMLNKKIDWQLGDKTSEIVKRYQENFATQDVDNDELESVIDQVLTNNPDAVNKFKAGKTQVIGFLLGQSMRVIAKKVDPNTVRQVLLKKLK